VADDFKAPAGGEMEVSASIKQPNPGSGLGYWPAFWMLPARRSTPTLRASTRSGCRW
jgi:hypothetical protein